MNNTIPEVTTAPEKQGSDFGKTAGILAVVCGIVGIPGPGPIFLPLTVIFAGIALWKRQYLLGILGSILVPVVFIFSPTLLGMVALLMVYKDWFLPDQEKKQQIVQSVLSQRASLSGTCSVGDSACVTNSANASIAPVVSIADKRAAVMEIGVKKLQEVDAAFKESTSSGMSVFRILRPIDIYGAAQDKNSAEIFSGVRSKVRDELSKLKVTNVPRKGARQGTIGDMQVYARFEFMTIARDDSIRRGISIEEGQLYARSLASIEDAIKILDSGKAPENCMEARVILSNKKSEPKDLCVASLGNGLFSVSIREVPGS